MRFKLVLTALVVFTLIVSLCFSSCKKGSSDLIPSKVKTYSSSTNGILSYIYTYYYDFQGRLINAQYSTGGKTLYNYSGDSLVISDYDSGSVTPRTRTAMALNSNGKISSSSTGAYYTYDGSGHMLFAISPGDTIKYNWVNDNITSVTETGQLGVISNYIYSFSTTIDSRDLGVQAFLPTSKNIETSFASAYPNDTTYHYISYRYDSKGRVSSVIWEGTPQVDTYTYY